MLATVYIANEPGTYEKLANIVNRTTTQDVAQTRVTTADLDLQELLDLADYESAVFVRRPELTTFIMFNTLGDLQVHNFCETLLEIQLVNFDKRQLYSEA